MFWDCGLKNSSSIGDKQLNQTVVSIIVLLSASMKVFKTQLMSNRYLIPRTWLFSLQVTTKSFVLVPSLVSNLGATFSIRQGFVPLTQEKNVVKQSKVVIISITERPAITLEVNSSLKLVFAVAL